MGDTVKVDRYWCLTEDRSRVVPETDPDARWLHWIPGMLVDRAEAERLGAVEPEGEPKRRGRPLGSKNMPKPQDKAIRPEANKGA